MRESYPLIDEALQGHELTPTQYLILSILGNHEEALSSAQLARRCGTSAQAMNQVIATLEMKDLISRHEDPDSRRILKIKLMSKGRQILGDCEKKVDVIEQRFFQALSEGEYMLLRELLMKVTATLREQPEAGGSVKVRLAR